MNSSVSFQTRARTIDHLGREQIADCPTAISELWKNAYDAYAKKVEMHIFDGEIPVASLVDDGHGMNREEFESKWLTVGTESKTSGFEIDEKDRGNLPLRPKQGQKGIGRLSSAALGSLLLIVSKRIDHPFVAALIDWRLFENPFIYLHDIKIPIVEFNGKTELTEKLPELFDTMMGNVWGDTNDSARNTRLAAAWQQFSQQESNDDILETTQRKIERTLINQAFTERHFEKWDVWLGESSQGTAMFITELHEDIEIQLSKTPFEDTEGPEQRARERMFQTLSNFTDPFSTNAEAAIVAATIDDKQQNLFSNSVTAWLGQIQRPIIDNTREFDIKNLEDLEHIVEGSVDEQGNFDGRIKAFGNWIENVKINPTKVYKTRRDTRFGPFHIRIGTFEMQVNSSTLTAEAHAVFMAQAQKYSGFRIYRDGLRVMPYGREDNDYFEIEKRRSKNAGRYFWSNRNMFGRIAITREHNPNLRDKAGREGFLENRASKLLREIVENLLIKIADQFFGRKSKLRQESLEDIKQIKEQEKADADRKKLLSKERKRVRLAIKANSGVLNSHISNLYEFQNTLNGRLALKSIDETKKLQTTIDELKETTQKFSLSPVPTSLGRIEEDYRNYRIQELQAKELVSQLSKTVNSALAALTHKSDYEVASEIYRSKLTTLNNHVTQFAKKGKELLSIQDLEFNKLVKECRDAYKSRTAETLELLKLERISLHDALNKLDEEQVKLDIENEQHLSPFISALTSIGEQIDLEGLAIHSMNETQKWREEVNRLHGLAQLGITVEIIGHEIEGLDMTITRGLKAIAKDGLSSNQLSAYNNVIHAQQSLSDKWRFLSPLKLSGEKISRRITGQDIYQYVSQYFAENFKNRDVSFVASDAFLQFHLFEQPARIYPIFVNLVNNSQYWIERNDCDNKQVLLDIKDGEVIIADTGPGVLSIDYSQLFTLFFTRKDRGGRGIGLYLCKQNLQAGGHKIRYETIDDNKLLPGANFAIEFKGMK